MNGSFVLTFVLAVSSICAEEAAMLPPSEKAIIKQLELGGANVVEKEDGLHLYHCRTEELIALAAKLERMASLDASFWRDEPVLTGQELRHLKGHKRLKELDLHGMPISGTHLEVLPSLPALELFRCSIKEKADEGLRYINGCNRLRTLSLDGSSLSSGQTLELGGLFQLEDFSASHTAVRGSIQVAAKWPKLRSISLSGTDIDDADLRAMSALKHVEEMYVSSPNVTDHGLEEVAKYSSLKVLAARCPAISANGIESLGRRDTLNVLDIGDVPLDKPALKALAGLGMLRRLRCMGRDVAVADRSELEASLQKCDVTWFEDDDAN